jgi:ABC-type transport system involved in cytochrome bd biosynthesis fused ATPase/permease subunit
VICDPALPRVRRGPPRPSPASRSCAAWTWPSAKGEILYIIGTSGVGKSVTIKHLVGFLAIDQGEIWFDGQRLDQLDERGFYPIRRASAWCSRTRPCSTR